MSFRFIHTSDWHLGLTLYDYERAPEHREMFRRLAEIVKTHKPDALLVSGDVFHTSQPSAAALELLSDGMAEIRRAAGPDMPVIVTAGNHDSPSRHEAERAIWNAVGVKMVGQVRRDDLSPLIIPVPGKALVIAVPYVHERNLPEDFWNRILALAEERNTEGLPLVMMAHTAVVSEVAARVAGHVENPDSIGGIAPRSFRELGSGYDYLALGHIHSKTTFTFPDSPALARYCGSPMAVSFDEEFEHTVSLVTISGHGPEATVDVEEIAVKDPCPPVTIPAKDFGSWTDCYQELLDFPADRSAYVRLNVEIDESFPTNARELAFAAAEGKKARFCYVNSRKPEAAGSDSAPRSMTVSEFREKSPLEIAMEYAKLSAQTLKPELIDMLREVINESANETDQA